MYAPDGDPKNFPGVKLEELPELEKTFGLNINVYELVEEEENDDDDGTKKVVAKVVQRSHRRYEDTMNLNLYKSHFSYICSMDDYSKSFACSKCGQLWKHVGMLHRHERSCDTNVKHKYVGGVYHLPETIFEKLADAGIDVPEEDCYYPFRATYDFECYFNKDDLPQNSEKVTWEARHVPLSVAVCSNVPGHDTSVCFVTEGDTSALVEKMMGHLNAIADEAYNLLSAKFEPVFEQLDTKIAEALKTEPGTDDDDDKPHPLQKLRQQFDDYLMELPVCGFNAGKYDVQVIKTALMVYLRDNDGVDFVVKKNNNFMCLKTKTLKFVDIINYLAPGFSYDKYLKAFGCSMTKGFLPYEYIDDLQKLAETQLPPHKAFYSQLKGENISEEEYAYCQRVWEEEGMETFEDFLVWYNCLDVKPFLEAIEKQSAFYKERHIDMLKDGISVPGLTMKYLFQNLPKDVYFTLYDEKNRDLHHLVKDQLCGGPSLIFHRYHEKDKTKLREADYGEEAETCQGVIGFDANALYLSAMMQDMPTGWYVRRKNQLQPGEDDNCDTNFKRETSHKYSHTAMEWMEWVMAQEGIHIQHEFNGKEKRIGRRQLPVDGWCQETQTVYQMHGCWWHGHECQKKDYNDVRQKPMKELRAETDRNTSYLKELGYEVIEIWECEWLKMKAQDKDLQRFIGTHFRRRLDRKQYMTEGEILNAVKTGELFGLVECDIHVPEALQQHFNEMQPIFKNENITRDDIGEMMREYAEEHNIMSQPRRSLIGSFKGEKILLATPLLQWYLEHGLVITHVYQVIQYWPDNCFEQFGKDVSNARRAGDRDPDQAIIADTMKLLGNSSYGKTITNKERHRDVKYCDAKEASKLVNDSHFRVLTPLDDNTYEVEMSKKKIKLDLPLHIGFFVYQYAKKRMLEFYYDCLDVFVDRRQFQLMEMDTDSQYLAITGRTLDEVVRPEKRREFFEAWPEWFPAEACDQHHTDFVDTKCRGEDWTTTDECCMQRKQVDKRTPGLFKVEWEGDGCIGLCSKTYYCFGGERDKLSCKGLNKKQNDLTKQQYLDVLTSKKNGHGTNRGFRLNDNTMYTYTQERAGLSFFYPKRIVAADGITTSPTLL